MHKFAIWLALLICLTGCAYRHPKVFAQRNPAHWPSITNKIALAAHQQSGQQETALGEALRSELTRRGFNLTPTATADYVLAYWVEENWNTIRPAGDGGYVGYISPVGVMTYEGSPVTAPGSLSAGVSPDGRLERYLVNEGIRLELYPRTKSGTTDLTTAWAGSIAGGSQLKTNQIPALLGALLDHFGQDFTGRVKLME